MLRESSLAFDYDIDIRAVSNRSIDPGIPGGVEILDFVDTQFGEGDPDAARRALQDRLGPEGLVDACGVFANFQMMNRLAEATGIPVPGAAVEREASIIEALALDGIRKH